MNKVYIISDKNTEKGLYETKRIVIFSENNSPRVIDYSGVEDFLPLVKIAEENGYDILGEKGIKPAIESGLIKVVSSTNKKAMDELKAIIFEEELAHSEIEEELEEEVVEEVSKEDVKEMHQ